MGNLTTIRDTNASPRIGYVGGAHPGLPPGYTRLESMLFFRAPALFVTDVVADNQTGVAVDTQMLADVAGVPIANTFGAACGSGTSATSSISYTRLNNGATGANYVYWGNLYRSMTVSGVDGIRHVETINWLNSRAITMDGVSVATALSATVTGFSPAPLSIGGTNNPDNHFTASQLFSGRIFGVKISQASEIVRDYVPCLDDAGVLVWYCLLSGHVARRKEFSGATWPDAGPPVVVHPELIVYGSLGGEADTEIAVTPFDVTVLAGAAVETTVSDSHFADSSPAIVDTIALVEAYGLSGSPTPSGPTTYASMAPSLVAVDSDGVCTRAGNHAVATAPIHVTRGGITRQAIVTVRRQTDAASRRLTGRVDNSLACEMDGGVMLRTVFVSPTDNLRALYSAVNWANATITRNPACILSDVDLTGLVVMNSWSKEAGRGGGVLIRLDTPDAQDIVILADHYLAPNKIGNQLMFVGQSGTVYTRTIASSKQVGSTDIRMARLDAPLPADVTPIPVLPDDAAAYLPTQSPYGAACWVTTQGGHVGVGYMDLYGTSASPFFRVSSISPYAQCLTTWRRDRANGDSGHPAIAVARIGGVPTAILIGLWQTVNGGPTPAGRSTAINATLSALGCTGKLLPADLSGYVRYGT